jgi:hemolysin activation/secretion protein
MRLLPALIAISLANQAWATDPSPRFEIRQFRVEGSVVLGQSHVDQLLAPFTGRDKDFADVQRALEKIEDALRQAGFGATQVYLPEQALEQGVVVFRVIEPKLGRVTVAGNRYADEANIRRALPGLREGELPNTRELTRAVRLANESPVRQMSVSLSAGEQPQTVDATIKVQDERPWRLFTSIDNTGTRETGRARLAVGVQHANLFNRDHLLTAQYTTSPEKPDKVSIAGIGYRWPLYDWGDSLNFFAGYSNAESGALSGLFTVTGKGRVWGARYTQHLLNLGTWQQQLQYGIDYRRFDTDTQFVRSRASSSGYAVRPLSLTWLTQWQQRGWAFGGNLGLAANLPGGAADELGRQPGKNPFVSRSGRPDANDDYWLLRFGGDLSYTTAGDWTVRISLNGQWTRDALVPGEQYGLGGANSLRGYEERELSNDWGYAGSLELYSPDLTRRSDADGLNLRLLGFIDAGYLARNKAGRFDRASDDLASWGVGARLSWNKRASVRLDVAQALRDAATTHKNDVSTHVSAVLVY